MNLMHLTRMSERNSHGKRKQLGIYLCDCGSVTECSVSEVKNGYKLGCNSCKGTRQSTNRTKLDIDTSVNSAYAKIKSQARIRNIEFSLDRDTARILMTSPCNYCGVLGSSYKIRTASVNGIDRIDSSIGYIGGNVVACCKKCNLAKHTMGAQEYIDHCQAVINYRKA